LREVLAARSDRDFVVAAPPRGGRARPAARTGLARRLIRFACRHPVEIAVTLVLSGAGGAIAWNALALQTARHPAPLFSPRATLDPAAPMPPLRPASAPPQASEADALVPPVAPNPQTSLPTPAAPAAARPARDSIGDLIRGSDPAAAPGRAVPAMPPARPTVTAAAAPPTVATPQKPPVMRDAIGDLIRLGEPAPIPPGFVGKTEQSRSVGAAQRALSRLGYGVAVDGLMGPGTRQAIEQFERDRRLPVTGELGPRTARELSAQSGIQVD
jgi:hypothetical protein